MALLHAALDVLRIVVASHHDDEVLDTPCDEKLAVVIEKPEIAGPKERPLTAGQGTP
jgi:hypothetical protein